MTMCQTVHKCMVIAMILHMGLFAGCRTAPPAQGEDTPNGTWYTEEWPAMPWG